MLDKAKIDISNQWQSSNIAYNHLLNSIYHICINQIGAIRINM